MWLFNFFCVEKNCCAMQAVSQDVDLSITAALDDHVTAEVQRAKNDQGTPPSPHTSGSVTTSAASILQADNQAGFPDVLPITTMGWPPLFVSLVQSYKSFSTMGLFPSMGCAYITVDNRLLAWNYNAPQQEYACYEQIPEVIVAVSDITAPATGVFQAHVTHLVAVASALNVYLVGVCAIRSPTRFELRFMNLGYGVQAPCLIRKLAVTKNGRIFAGGADGCLYEVLYTKADAYLTSRMRLVNHSVYFGPVPLLNVVGKTMNAVAQTWWREKPIVIDLAVDEDRQLLVMLAEGDEITVYRLGNETAAVTQLLSLVHNTQDKRAHNVIQPSPLTSIAAFNGIIRCTAASGDSFRYRLYEPWGTFSRITIRAEQVEYTPSPLGPGRVPDFVWSSPQLHLYFHRNAPQQDGASPGEVVTVVTQPRVVLKPHEHCRVQITQIQSGSISGVTAAAMEGVPVGDDLLLDDVHGQVLQPPQRIVIAHMFGVTVFAKLRPVDILHCILSCAPEGRRDPVLQRFYSSFSPTEYCCMLVQIASGLSGSLRKEAVAESLSGSDGNSFDRLGAALVSDASFECQLLARELLRREAQPRYEELPSTTSRTAAVTMSPLVSGCCFFLARSVIHVWSLSLFSIDSRSLETVLQRLSGLLSVLDQVRGDAWTDSTNAASAYQLVWERLRVTISLPPSQQLTLQDMRILQSRYTAGLRQYVDSIMQVLRFASILRSLPGAVRDLGKFTVRELVSNRDIANEFARQFAKIVVDESKNTARGAESEKVMLRAQRECPHLFKAVHAAEFHARMHLDRGAQWGAVDSGRWDQEITANAAALWRNNSLLPLCQELCAKGKHEEAIDLLLRTAQQLDPPGLAAPLYYTSRATYGAGEERVRQEKQRILKEATDILEQLWEPNRAGFLRILGTAGHGGTLWSVESNDELTHVLLFDWCFVERNDADVVRHLEEAALWSGSRFVEKYLRFHAQRKGVQFATYLRLIKRNYAEALDVLSRLARGPLSDTPDEHRLHRRISLWRDAVECAREGKLTGSLAPMEMSLKLCEAQYKLGEVVQSYLSSGNPSLTNRQEYNGELMTERDIGQRLLREIFATAMPSQDLFEKAGWFPTYGGGFIQLKLLLAERVIEKVMYAEVLTNIVQYHQGSFEDLVKRLLTEYYDPLTFPLAFLVRATEQRSYRELKEGGGEHAVNLLAKYVDLSHLFAAYVEILERRDGFLQGNTENVPETVFALSLAYVVGKLIDQTATVGRFANPQASSYLSTAVEIVSNIARVEPKNQNVIRAQTLLRRYNASQGRI